MVRKLLLAALCACSAAEAATPVGSMSVIGSSSARLCFKAADSTLPSSVLSIGECDAALKDGNLSGRDQIATLVNRGILYLRKGDSVRAMADYDAAIARDPKEPEAYLNKGAALLRNPGDPKAALPMFDAALAHGTSKPALAYYGRGLAHEYLGDLKSAYYDYKRAEKLEPEWDQPRLELTRFTVRSN